MATPASHKFHASLRRHAVLGRLPHVPLRHLARLQEAAVAVAWPEARKDAHCAGLHMFVSERDTARVLRGRPPLGQLELHHLDSGDPAERLPGVDPARQVYCTLLVGYAGGKHVTLTVLDRSDELEARPVHVVPEPADRTREQILKSLGLM